jgi:predicted cobalt transporter CbtA
MPLKKLIAAALLAGLFASFLTAGFHWLFTEPIIDRAVAIEAEGAAHAEEPVVGRPMQKLGLFVGYVVYGLAWGTLLATLVYALGPELSAASARGHFLVALFLGWSVGLFPLLKYPANPPGLGEAATIGYRQEWFVIAMALSLVGMVAAVAARKSLRRSRYSAALVAAAYAIYLIIVYAALPENPDPMRLDADLVRTFRLLSCAGQVLFWIALGGAFAALLRLRAADEAHAQ